MNTHKHNDSAHHTFNGLGIAPSLIEALEKHKLTTPTPIQYKAIPLAIEGKDLIGIAQTGTGKTLAFGIPLLQRLAREKGRGLVLLPTRELAIQVEEELKKIGRSFGLRTALLIGGAAMGPQRQALNANPHVIIATPGRLIDHFEQRFLNLNDIKILVLDEADRMLDMGFLPQIRKVLFAIPRARQTMLFSATLSREIMQIASHEMKLPISIEVAPPGTTAERVVQEFFIVKKEDKIRLLEKILMQYRGSTLVFTKMKFGAKRVAHAVRAMGHDAAEIHSNRSLGQRREALEGFKSGKYRVLVATDIAARGIDVKGIELVVNFDLPMQAADYVHRIGRTARAGAEGRAISFAMPEEKRDIRDIERLIQQTLPVSALPDLPPTRVSHGSMEREPRSGGRRAPFGYGTPRRSGHGRGGGQRRSHR